MPLHVFASMAMLLHVGKQLGWLAAFKGCSFSARMIEDGLQPDILSFQAQIGRAHEYQHLGPICPAQLEAAAAATIRASTQGLLSEFSAIHFVASICEISLRYLAFAAFGLCPCFQSLLYF